MAFRDGAFHSFAQLCNMDIPFLSCTAASPTDEWELAVRERWDLGEPERDRECCEIFSGVADRDLDCCGGDRTALLDLLDLGLSLGDLEVAELGVPCKDILEFK